MTSKMIACRFYQPLDARIEEVDIPSINEKEVLIRTRLALTCGSDVKMYKRGHPLVRPPVTIGHEFAGTVEKRGRQVSEFPEGARVVAANSAPCNNCHYCTKNKRNLCERSGEKMGFSSPGSYAELIPVPANIVLQNMFIVPDNVRDEEAAFLEPLACVVHGNKIAQINEGESVLIMGSGPIGLLHLQLARLNGASPIIVADPHDEKLGIAKTLGADHVLNSRSEDYHDRINELTDGKGPEIVVEAVGRVEAWQNAFNIVDHGGKVLLFGGCPAGTEASFDTGKLHYGEVKLLGTFHHDPQNVSEAFRLICEHSLELLPMISRRMHLREARQALEELSHGRELKIALYPS